MRIILDTNVLYAALRNNGVSAIVFKKVSGQQENLYGCVSTALLLEYEEILKNKLNDINKIRKDKGLSLLTIDDIDAILDYYASQCLEFGIPFSTRPILNDPDDEFIVDLATISGAVICTSNKKDFKQAIAPYRLIVLNPVELLERLKNETN